MFRKLSFVENVQRPSCRKVQSRGYALTKIKANSIIYTSTWQINFMAPYVQIKYMTILCTILPWHRMLHLGVFQLTVV